MINYDAIVVGGGPGGYECAIRLSQNGLKTALVEAAELGGTCLNRGCIPTKALLHSADVYREAKNSEAFGISAGDVTFDYAKMVERKNKVTAQLRQGIAFLEQSHGVTVYNSRAYMTGSHTMKLSSGEELEGTNIVLATGSLPASVPIPGIDLDGVMDSTDLLNMTECPKEIVIVGGGVIGIEFATLYSTLGSKVTIIEMLDRILAPLDKEVSMMVSKKLKKNKVSINLGCRVESIEEGLKVNYSKADGSKAEAHGDVVLIAGGRVANSKNMGFEEIGIEMDRKGFVVVDDFCRTNLQGVFAIGDLNGKMQLAHVASAQGLMVADLVGGKEPESVNLKNIPSCVYSNPETAMIGMTEEQAFASGKEIGKGYFNLFGNGKALSMGENDGFVKILFDKANNEILGCHIIGPRATDLIGEISSVIHSGGTVEDIANAVHPHPTVCEAVMEAAHDCFHNCTNVPKMN